MLHIRNTVIKFQIAFLGCPRLKFPKNEHLKARLVAKGYTKTYGVDYLGTFSTVARLSSVWILLFVAISHSWPL